MTTLPPGQFDEYCNQTENYAEIEKKCSIISDPEGDYKKCHQTVNPDKAKEDCIFDVCNSRDDSYVERNTLSYLEDCLDELREPIELREYKI